MGGGVVMRAAAKVAGIGLLNGGLRGGDKSVVSAARQASRSVASVVSSSDDVKLAIANSDNNVDSAVAKPYDDWDFASVEDELFMEESEPMPRLVFGGVPTIEEAKEATLDLTDALEKTYLSSNAINGQISSALSDSEDGETKNILVTESPVSKNAIQAFKLLNQSSSARNVVASIASDPNVWDAVLKNEALVDFLESHQTSVVFPEFDLKTKGESESKAESGKGFMDYVNEFKDKVTETVVEMMNSLTDTFQTLFGGPQIGEFTVNEDGTAGISMEKSAIGATLMGLAIMVITVVVVKRS